ncbi:MAG: molybdate ABC transporter substrate-binding protein [Alphaproteobacteria bacterium]|nr:molybdate ABC transporter substrate-binding protein [Alphaproteobacteria bacterium]
MFHLRLTALFAALLMATAARAETATVAVAANFAGPAQEIAAAFAAASGHRLEISTGSSGAFYAQIVKGAPFDAFLSADAERPARLAAEGHGPAASAFTYAVGRLGLWSADPARIGPDGTAALRTGFRYLAIANPAVAPYGAAAREALEKLGLWRAVESRIVMGHDIGQTFQMAATGNAEMGFVALSQAASKPGRKGSVWTVPAALHAPIRHDAILLARGAGNAAARDFLAFLKAPAAEEIIRRYGYDVFR